MHSAVQDLKRCTVLWKVMCVCVCLWRFFLHFGKDVLITTIRVIRCKTLINSDRLLQAQALNNTIHIPSSHIILYYKQYLLCSKYHTSLTCVLKFPCTLLHILVCYCDLYINGIVYNYYNYLASHCSSESVPIQSSLLWSF